MIYPLIDSYRMYHVQLELFLFCGPTSSFQLCYLHKIECLVITFLYLVLATSFLPPWKTTGVFFTMEIGIVLAYVQKKKAAVWMNVSIWRLPKTGPKSSKSFDHDLVLKAMVTTGDFFSFRNPHKTCQNPGCWAQMEPPANAKWILSLRGTSSCRSKRLKLGDVTAVSISCRLIATVH